MKQSSLKLRKLLYLVKIVPFYYISFASQAKIFFADSTILAIRYVRLISLIPQSHVAKGLFLAPSRSVGTDYYSERCRRVPEMRGAIRSRGEILDPLPS